MLPIVSRTTTERIVRWGIFAAMVVIWCAWFLRDGYVGWPQKNLAKAIESLDPVPEELPPINPSISSQAAREFAQVDARRTRKDLEERFGPPGWEKPDGSQVCYFGPAGVIAVELVGDLVMRCTFVPGDKGESELFLQKVLGYILLVLGVVVVGQWVRVIATRVVLSEEGLKVRGRPLIPFSDMVRTDNTRYRKKGHTDLYYSRDGRERVVRLDDYVIREFRPIMEEICARTDVENPIMEAEEEEAPTAAGEPSSQEGQPTPDEPPETN